MSFKLQSGYNKCTNSQYHGDLSWLSSSKLKLLLEDPAVFHAQVILAQAKESVSAPNLDEGSLFHSYILEPELVNHEYAFFDGLRKAGREYESFKEANSSKPIISAAQHGRVLHWVRGHKKNLTATKLMEGGENEYSLCTMLSGVPVKMRADKINIELGYIIDLKTSAFEVDPESFKMTCVQWGYFLSAALYTAIAEAHFNKKFDFYFIPTCKSDGDTRVYKMGERSMIKGRGEVGKALDMYKKCMQTGLWVKSEPVVQHVEEIIEI